MAALPARLAPSLEYLYDRRSRGWIGSREGGPPGTTLGALADRGFAEVQWTKKPYERLVGRINAAGVAEVERRRRARAARDLAVTHSELDVLEGLVRTAEAGDRLAALETLERLRSVAVEASS